MTRARDIATGSGIESGEVVPHIIPGMLYPAIAGKLFDGSTSHSGDYGTAQSDGRSYYWTSILGSRPIKDPRIGAHFGSQRHKFTSVQILEQETAIHGKTVHSVDGRDWIRTVSNSSKKWDIENADDGVSLRANTDATGMFIEVTGYFNDYNFLGVTSTDRVHDVDLIVNGTESINSANIDDTTVNSPLKNRMLSAASLINVGSVLATSLGTTPKINTLKMLIGSSGQYVRWHGCELIAQDRTSVTTRSQIQIPSQNVVSYGKKFTISGTPHYNPFAFKTDGTTAWASGDHNGTAWPIGTGSSANIDTATSLGLDAWVSTNYYKPYNGGRVVWWVDSSGTLKCSVNMMPPNARSGRGTAINEKGDDSAGTTSAAVANNTYLPTFTDQAIDHSQAEVAKTFHWREFGNGAANGGTGAAYADTSMLSTSDDTAYVMDDGLTTFVGDNGSASNNDYLPDATNDIWYNTFIGTGFSHTTSHLAPDTYDIAQNLSYGTHVISGYRRADGAQYYEVDGSGNLDIAAGTYAYASISEVTIYQPKMPPIPDNSVVVADYMLCADWVAMGDAETKHISKGARRISASRDVFYDRDSGSSTITSVHLAQYAFNFGLRITAGAGNVVSCDLPVFSDKFAVYAEDISSTDYTLAFGGTASTITSLDNSVDDDTDACVGPSSSTALGVNKIELNVPTNHHFHAFDAAGIIHTSSHYQTFETPFLHELVGGDRNMEQHNLIVTPDGKTWNEVTRDTSYIGNQVCNMATDTTTTWATVVIFDDWRGEMSSRPNRNLFNKDFAIAYDRLICLVDGQYKLEADMYVSGTGDQYSNWQVNATYASTEGRIEGISGGTRLAPNAIVFLKRGDYVQLIGEYGDLGHDNSQALITRLK